MLKLINKHRMIWLILLTNVIPPLSIDQYTPSLPAMVQAFGVSVSLMQLTITGYMFAFALSQLACGALSDRFGRRPVLLWSAPLYLFGTLAAIFSPSISILMLGRLLQGLGMGAMALTGPALMSDCFEGDELIRVGGYYGMVYSFIPIAGPIIGGLIQDAFGWRYNFGFMLVLSVVIIAVFLKWLPETHQPNESHRLSVKNIIHNYWAVLSNKTYILSVAALMLIWTLFIVFSMMAPFIMQVILHFSATAYGFQALLTGLGFLVGSSANNHLINMFSAKRALHIGLIGMVVGSLILVLLVSLNMISAWSLLTPIFGIMIFSGIAFPHLYGKAASAVPEYAGIAGALIGALILMGAVVVTAAITLFNAHSPLMMASVYVVLSVLALCIAME